MTTTEEPSMLHPLTQVATESDAGSRVDRFLADVIPDCSRAQIQRAAAMGALTVDGRAVKPSHRLRPGDTVNVTLIRPEPTDTPPVPEAIDLDVIHEDEHLIVINKPAGMVVHPAVGHRTGTLVNALLGRGVFATGTVAGSAMRPGIVHRLDKGTSGLLVCARTESAHRNLSEQLKERTLTRVYRAVSWGLFKTGEFTIDEPIGRAVSDRKMMAVTPRGRAAKTHVQMLERFLFTELLEVTLETGRTHQIRVHLSYMGHPIVGDSAYGGGAAHLRGIDPHRRLNGKALITAIGRPALHAYKLSLEHPATGERMEWSVEPPEDFLSLLELCRA